MWGPQEGNHSSTSAPRGFKIGSAGYFVSEQHRGKWKSKCILVTFAPAGMHLSITCQRSPGKAHPSHREWHLTRVGVEGLLLWHKCAFSLSSSTHIGSYIVISSSRPCSLLFSFKKNK